MFAFVRVIGRGEEEVANEYAKVVLYAYPYLPALIDAVGVGAVNKAMLSFRAQEDALKTAEKIADELAVKSRLMRLECAVGETLAALNEDELYLLEYKYFRRGRVLRERYADYSLNCSERTYFRRQCAVLRKFVCGLARHGWSEQEYDAAFGGFSPFVRVLEALKTGREGAVTQKRVRKQRNVTP